MPLKAPLEILNISKIIGSFIQHWGFKKIHGQIWTLVFLSKEPVNSTMITKQLHVSKALVSLAVKDLLKYEVLIVAERKNKEIYFRSNPDVFRVIVQVLNNRERLMLEEAKNSVAELQKSITHEPQKFHVDSSKVQELHNMIESAQASLIWLTTSFSEQK